MVNKKGTSKLSNAERVARWRKNQRENKEKHEEYKRKERERYRDKKRRGVIRSITEMSEREKRIKRKNWRQSSNDYYKKKKSILNAIENTMTPPNSPEYEQINQPQAQTSKQLGRKKVRKDRSKAYREIFKLRVALSKQERLKEKYKKRLQRQQKTMPSKRQQEDEIIKGHDVRKAILLYSVIIDRMKKRYRKTKKQEEKRKISSLVCSTGLVKKYRLGNYAKNMLGLTNCQMKPKTLKRKRCIKATRVRQAVHAFLERDDNSHIKADKKATATKGGHKKQIRILTDDMKHLHAKYISEFGNRNISYSLFCKLRPFNIRSPTAKDRETCMCKIHENLQYKLESAHAAKLYGNKNVNDIIKTVTCDKSLDQKDCMYRVCPKCKDKKVPKADTLDEGKQIRWKMWKNRRINASVRVVKEVDSGTLAVLDEEVNKEIQRAARHIYNIRHQYKAMACLKEHFRDDEVLIHVDFSENYQCKLAKEIQSCHFGASQRQVSLHTGIAYTRNILFPFATLSDCLIHSPIGIWGHLAPILETFRSEESAHTNVHFLSDGPTTQYRNKMNMYLFSTKIYDLGFTHGTWNFLEAGHGKGAADGIGAVIKRTGDNWVQSGHDITCASDLKEALFHSGSNINIFEIMESDILSIELPQATTIRAVPQTMRIHQATTSVRGVISTRDVSCFCNRTGASCNCFHPVVTIFNTVNSGSKCTVDMPAEKITSDNSTLSQDTNEMNSGSKCTVDMPAEKITSDNSTLSQDDVGSDRIPEGACSVEDTNELTQGRLKPVDTVDESLIGMYIVVEYDGLPYPGEVQDVDEDDLEVKVMHKIGRNRFFWPLIDDIIWYGKDKVVAVLDGAPEKVTGRHCKINQDVWNEIEKLLNL